MTTLILAQKKIRSWCPEVNITRAEDWFLAVNRRGMITYALLALTGFFICLYLIALYVTFDLGFGLKKVNPQVTKVSEEALLSELTLHNAQTGLIREKNTLYGQMEEVTSLKYIFTEDGAVSYQSR